MSPCALLSLAALVLPSLQEPAAPALDLEALKADAPDPALVAKARAAGAGIAWIRDPFEMEDVDRATRRLRPPEAPSPISRAALLDEALTRARAEGKAVLLYACRIEGRHMYRAPLVDDYMQLALFSDPELCALIARRFVPLRLYVTAEVGERLGIKNTDREDPLFLQTVEPALVVLAPDGTVVHKLQRIRTFSVPFTRGVLRRALARCEGVEGDSAMTRAVAAAPEAASQAGRLALAEAHALDGHEDEAARELATLLGELDEAAKDQGAPAEAAAGQRPRRGPRRDPGEVLRFHGWLALARALRLDGRLEEAATAVAALRGLQSANPNLLRWRDGEAALEAARLAELGGRWAEVPGLLAAAPESAERHWREGVALWQQWKIDEAEAAFAEAARGAGDYAARAAAMLATGGDTTPLSPLAHGFEWLEQGGPAVHKGLPASTELPVDPADRDAVAAVERRALGFLLAQQRPDGSWSDARYAYWPSPVILPNVRVAVTALAATALLAWRDLAPEAVDRALAKAEEYMLEPGRVRPDTEEAVYSQGYRILYFARRLAFEAGRRDRKDLAAMERLLKEVRALQDPKTGFFAHEYKNAFCTGAMMWSLYLARTLELEVDEDVVRLGIQALQSARREDGSYSYGGAAGTRSGSISANLKNASARMPLCEAVLHVFGQSDEKKLAAAFEVFLEHLDSLARVRKCDFHSDGQLGGFFFWHAVFHASEARRLVEPALRERVGTALSKLVLSIPEIDGSFVDSHELGKSYGTAMALLVLANLRSDGDVGHGR
ncbi:MAG: hypothetical protein R3F30_09415 [Planctomycetota bacterium]